MDDNEAAEIMARAMCWNQGTDPDELVFNGQLYQGPRGALVMPSVEHQRPAWQILEYDARRALDALREAGFTIQAPTSR